MSLLGVVLTIQVDRRGLVREAGVNEVLSLPLQFDLTLLDIVFNIITVIKVRPELIHVFRQLLGVAEGCGDAGVLKLDDTTSSDNLRIGNIVVLSFKVSLILSPSPLRIFTAA